MIKLYEIKLVDFNEDQEKILYALWKRWLQRDSWWHFFYEGNYSLLRVSKSFVSLTEGFLKRKKVTYISLGEWVDNISTTKKFQSEFLYIFHGYSELAMKNIGSGSSQIEPILDRITHCFMNNMSSNKRRKALAHRWEPLMIANSAIGRAETIGLILGGYYDKKSKQRKDSKAPKKDSS